MIHCAKVRNQGTHGTSSGIGERTFTGTRKGFSGHTIEGALHADSD